MLPRLTSFCEFIEIQARVTKLVMPPIRAPCERILHVSAKERLNGVKYSALLSHSPMERTCLV